MPEQIAVRSAARALDRNCVLILTTNSVEKAAVNQMLADATPAQAGFDTDGCRIGRIGGLFVLHITGTSGAQTPKSVARMARGVMSSGMLTPNLVLVVGFGWGNPDLAKAGQVIVSTQVWGVNHVRQRAGKTTRKLAVTDSPIVGAGDLIDLLAEISGSSATYVSGPILSSETFLADTKVRNALLKGYPNAVGGDMEAYDLVPDLKVPWVLIKAVSDAAADDTDSTEQRDAAGRAAAAVPQLLAALTETGALPPNREEDHSTLALLDALSGRLLRIEHHSLDGPALSQYLNDSIGPSIERRLRQYGNSSYADRFESAMTSLLLEVAQNAMRHGAASYASIDFLEMAIVMRDDGRRYDLSTLREGRGGADAWAEFRQGFVEPGRVKYGRREPRHGQGNIYKFDLVELSAELIKARKHCSVAIYPTRSSGPSRVALDYDQSCEVLFIEVGSTRMHSIRYDIADDVEALLLQGKRVFLSCRDKHDRVTYAQRLSAYLGTSLTIFDAHGHS